MNRIVLFFSAHFMIFCLFIAAIAISFWMLQFQRALNMKWYIGVLIALLHLAIGYGAAKLWPIIEVGGNLEKAANLRLYGAVFILPVLYYIAARWTRRKVTLVMDIAAVSLCMGLFITRMNCFSRGCCTGLPIPGLDGFCWPIREAEELFYLIFLLIFTGKILKKKTNGEAMPIYFIVYGTLRFVMEWVRDEFTTQMGIFHIAHIWSILAVIIGSVWYYRLYCGKKRTSARKRKN